MTKTKSVSPICAMKRGVGISVSSDWLPRPPVGGQRAPAFLDVRLVLVTEVLQRRHDRRHRGVAEGAERLAGDVRRDVRQQIEIAHLSFAALDLRSEERRVGKGC